MGIIFSNLYQEAGNMQIKKSINAKDFVLVSMKRYQNFLESSHRSSHKKQDSSSHYDFLDKIRRTNKLRKNKRYFYHPNQGEQPSEATAKGQSLMIESHRSFSPAQIKQSIRYVDTISLQKSHILQDEPIQIQQKTHKRNKETNRSVKPIVPAKIKQFRLNLRDKHLQKLQHLNEYTSVQSPDKKLNPYQQSIRNKKLNKIKLKINSEQFIVNTHDQDNEQKSEDSPTTKNKLTIINNRISALNRTFYRTKKNNNKGTFSKSIVLRAPQSQPQKQTLEKYSQVQF